MKILVIKQTSLGDVLHATPHLRAIKEKYPGAHLTVLTAQTSVEIYRNNPHIDCLVTFDYARFKQLGFKHLPSVANLFKATQREINAQEYDLAFDLQGLLRSVLFLYFAKAKKKYVKGRWLGLNQFRNKKLHAIDEMSQVLALANIPVSDTQMEFMRTPKTFDTLQAELARQNLSKLFSPATTLPFVVISPFTRWKSKNWPLNRFIKLAQALSEKTIVLITGTAKDKDAIVSAIDASGPSNGKIHNLAGALTLAELAELMSRSSLVISGDSFPMHLATAVGAPLITLFGPTDERKTGPCSENSRVLRPDDCQRCDRPNCSRACLNQIPVEQVRQFALSILEKEGPI